MATTCDDILTSVCEYYAEKVRRHGAIAEGVDWNSRKAQYVRFDQLLRLCEPDKVFTLNDYGCGYGALASYMRDRGYSFHYRGFDISPEMIARAREVHENASNCIFFTEAHSLTPADYTVASGIFNVKLDTSENNWTAYVFDTLDRLAAVSRRGFGFNALTAYADRRYRRPDLYYADPTFLFDHCIRRYSRQTALLHDYGLYDFTILVKL